jgi:eukaryotic-like serine/threonine-protein kinase
MTSIVLGTTFTGPDGEIFRTTDFLGNGAFGEVYRSVGETSGTVVAVKLLPVGTLPSDESRLALLNEVKAAQQVKHPNVVQVLFVNDGTASQIGPYVVMEYVSGGTLAKWLRAQEQSGTPVPVDRAIEMMVEIAQGARAINEKIIHRDIKPDNILIEGSTLKIGDFGISKFVDESTRLHTFKGGQHIAYMAPEGWQGLPNTFKLDVYSVGLVFHQVLTAKHPLLSKVKDPGNFLDWQKAHLYEPCADVRSFRRDVPLPITQLLARMVSKSAGERPDWEEVLKVLSRPEVVEHPANPAIAAAVEAAVSRQRENERAKLESAKQQSWHDEKLALYRYSCSKLVADLKPLVAQFNDQFQHGKIKCDDGPITTFRIPLGHDISILFFAPSRTVINIRGGEVIGGGWIGLNQGRGANLVLLRHGADDLYGRWTVCEIGISPIMDTSKLIGRYGVELGMPLPFGFKDAYFYDQIQYATGIMHAFTYQFEDDVNDYFARLLLDACSNVGR